MEYKSLAEYKLLNHNILSVQNEVKLTNAKGVILNISDQYCINKLLANTVLNENGCWDYIGRRSQSGYGEVSTAGTSIRAHRLSYYYFHKQNPGELFILHSCDRKCCVNPAHIRRGTHEENMKEASERYRMRRGENNNKTRFSDKEVVEIVKRYNEIRNYKAVADEFNCSDFAIKQIINSPTRTREAGLDSKKYLANDAKNVHLQEVIKMDRPIKSMGGNSKLTWDIVNQIRKDYETIKSPAELGRLHNVCRKTVAKIVANKSWVVNEETLREQREFTKEEIEAIKARYVVLKSCTKLAAELGIGINRTRRLVKT